MRTSVFKSVARVLALAVAFAVVAEPAFAQRQRQQVVRKSTKKSPQASNSKSHNQLKQALWLPIKASALPQAVVNTKAKAFPRARITKAEQTGLGASAFYRLTLKGGPVAQAIVAADGTVK